MFSLDGNCQDYWNFSTGHKWNKNLESEMKLLTPHKLLGKFVVKSTVSCIKLSEGTKKKYIYIYSSGISSKKKYLLYAPSCISSPSTKKKKKKPVLQRQQLADSWFWGKYLFLQKYSGHEWTIYPSLYNCIGIRKYDWGNYLCMLVIKDNSRRLWIKTILLS